MSTKALNQKLQNAKHVVIIGGGFAGVNCACKLASHSKLRITLIDRNNFQQFQPLLYQVAASMLTPGNDAFVLRNLFKRHANADVKMGEVVSVDLHTRTATTAEGQRYQGDYLILAAGSRVNFFGLPGAEVGRCVRAKWAIAANSQMARDLCGLTAKWRARKVGWNLMTCLITAHESL